MDEFVGMQGAFTKGYIEAIKDMIISISTNKEEKSHEIMLYELQLMEELVQKIRKQQKNPDTMRE
jgi:NTP pyrophosphatase (non-canonical NTP hydrolase)